MDGIYGSALFAANPLADFTDSDTSDGSTPQVTERRLYAEAVDALLARDNPVGEILFDLTDHLGSVRGWVEPDGMLIESLACESFGHPVSGWSSSSRFGFMGRARAGRSELWVVRASYEGDGAGRFINQDPIGMLAVTLSSAGYC